MKKRVLAGILMMVCVLASVMSVSAANSPIKEPVISETTGDNISNAEGNTLSEPVMMLGLMMIIQTNQSL